jgi:tetratricopeptide (TPR) repeat protein
MIPLPPPPHGIDEEKVVRQLALLDPCSAWRADLAGAGLREPLSEARAEEWLLWLQIATVFDRLRALPVQARAAYARSTGALWTAAERVTGEARFARVGEVMAGWEGAAPELAGFRELLWAVEQGEAEGALRVTYNALLALSMSLPRPDIRQGYADAQAGRILRTVGLLEQALRAFESADEIAAEAGDRWLQVRVKLGVGVVYHTRGNYPASREAFGAALHQAHPHVDLVIGAHLGLVSVARAIDDYGLALEHGWHALQCARGNANAEVEALTILAALSIEVGEYTAALRSCQLAMSKSPRPHMRTELLRYLVQAFAGLGDRDAALMHVPALAAAVESTQNPWQEAQGRRVLGETFAQLRDMQTATTYLNQSLEIARRGGYAELLHLAEKSLALYTNAIKPAASKREYAASARGCIGLDDESLTVIEQLSCLAVA